jgi:hypothetical protein
MEFSSRKVWLSRSDQRMSSKHLMMLPSVDKISSLSIFRGEVKAYRNSESCWRDSRVSSYDKMKVMSSDCSGMHSITKLKRSRLTLSAGGKSSSTCFEFAIYSSSSFCNALANTSDWCFSKSSLGFRVSRFTSKGRSWSDLFSLTNSLMSVSELIN